MVAGAGIEPASRGYEPREVPLLYPAIRLHSTYYDGKVNLLLLNIAEFLKDAFVESDDSSSLTTTQINT